MLLVFVSRDCSVVSLLLVALTQTNPEPDERALKKDTKVHNGLLFKSMLVCESVATSSPPDAENQP